ncbi:Polyhydroxyalkanoate depolymerase [Candidatus Trichorickettsia mobilis]|uniref:Polyhydroxyalkanoate depolymerase n=1 Tax=Candidatus Trichorickettsia mobilis TaxID=1346319 RepID=A0ABZ0URS1_9RICK|nr:polyhydroxyalkanoate depolymerase [Candidatus Trichorickettsia mobilis]WPY00343.1 Polyhydroxyalkanoate depolymerase [Candidatus Trichorickettsia mobilis]
MHKYVSDNFNYLYYMVEASRMQMSPMRLGAMSSLQWFENSHNPIYNTEFARTTRACLEIVERMTRKYQKPDFDITECKVTDELYKVEKQTILGKAFCNLQHFVKLGLKQPQPKLLIIAPMAGHHATLLRGTVQDTLPYCDVFITDWIDASQVPLSLGSFDMDDFIDYIIDFMKILGPDLHVMAVCQPTVPLLAATAIMSAEQDPLVPKSMILMGGPIDARKNPTQVNVFATGRSIEWFENMVITIVPPNYPGYMRHVYPGFLQLAGFMSLNLQRHVDSHFDMFKNLLIEEDDKADVQKKFYDEYLSVMDLPAEFYLQTIKEVFQEFSLAKGELVSRGRKVDLKSITTCSLLGIEGEKDDIAAVGQTKAALNLCTNIPQDMKKYHLQKGVGHYGVFSGSKFRQFIVPEIRDFIYTR